jgi:hypothetical protein
MHPLFGRASSVGEEATCPVTFDKLLTLYPLCLTLQFSSLRSPCILALPPPLRLDDSVAHRQ